MRPRKLLTQLFLLLTLLMAISVIAWSAIFAIVDREPRARQFAQILTSVANITRAAVIAAAPERRQDLLSELSRQEGIRIDIAEPGEVLAAPPDEPFLRDVLAHLQHSLGPGTALQLERNGESALFLKIVIAGDDYWIILPRERFGQSRSFQWLGWGMLAALLALLAAVGFVSRLTRPLRKLAAAATEIGAGRHPPPLSVDGPEELGTVARAFNRMNADLARMEQDRALVLAGISHDLRTPLTRLRMGLEMGMTEDQLRTGMIADIEDIDRTIGQFLDFSRADDGETGTDTDLAGMLEDIAAQYRQRNVDVAVATLPACHVKAKPKALRRAVANLIDNAARHAGTDRTIDLCLALEGPWIRITVGDHGPGIPVAEMERVRRPFTRLESARSDSVGAGLGLAIVERVAQLHGGRLELENRKGGGLAACILLPLAG